VDFERDDLVTCLLTAGFDRTVPTVGVWEGVTNYLTPDAVDATLAALRGLIAPGGHLILTYIDARALATPSPFPEAGRWVQAVARAGEPWIFGLLPGPTTEEYFTARGFRPLLDVSTLEAGRDWFTAMHRPETGSHLYRITLTERAGEPSTPPQPQATHTHHPVALRDH
jgi:O-methyltransferase involved in polyketide biosynthesis